MSTKAIGLSVVFFSGILTGCATPPLQTDSVDSSVTPAQVVTSIEGSVTTAAQPTSVDSRDAMNGSPTEGTVVWGGVIVNSTNAEGGTQLEILSYPLGPQQRPRTNRAATGRFLAMHEGYLETVDYAPGRQVTLVGRITGTADGNIGEATYEYATLAAQQIHLWSAHENYIHHGLRLGIGINISN